MSAYTVYSNSPSITTSCTSTSADTITLTGSMSTSGGYVLTSPSVLDNTYISIGSNGMSYDDLKPASLHVKGNSEFEHDANFKGRLTVGGKDLGKCLEDIEARLNILRPNHSLEAEWDELRELGEKYRRLEKDMLEKLALVDVLKKKL